jgi:hypothetical protein
VVARENIIFIHDVEYSDAKRHFQFPSQRKQTTNHYSSLDVLFPSTPKRTSLYAARVVRWILLLFLSFFFVSRLLDDENDHFGEKVLSSCFGGEIQFFSFGGEEDSNRRF